MGVDFLLLRSMYAIKADLRLLVFFGVIVQLLGCATDLEEKKVSNSQSTAPLFTLLPAAQTKINFQNTLTEGLNTNILMYEYFYNGGGVAVGDFNGDGLEDLYFTANMEDNKMYLNKGNLQFEDVTLLTGAQGRPGPWKTGVTAVDINGDHLLDLYICYSGALPEAKRTNQLFINKGNNVRGIPLFEDEAEKYGLASPAHSTQAYFFDYDHDHDLDMLLLNHNPKNLPILNEESTAEMMKQDDPLRSTRLYRQTNGRFEDVTIQSGINGSPLSYGLGLGISDLNADGWPDFYISNDYAVPDYLYINNKDGTFTNQISSLGHISEFSMGNDIVDFNNDGWQDIFTLDMLPEDNHRQKLLLAPDNYAKFDLHVRSGFYYQYMRNMLQLNNGNGSFSEIGQLAGISNTDWSWSALLADFDEDGYKDLHVTNGYKRDYTNLDFINYMDDYVKTKGRLVREDVMDIIGHMPASNVSNYIFANQGDLSFKNLTTDWGLNRPSNSNGAVYADLDQDGDLDLVVNNINEPAFVYRNESNNRKDIHYINILLRGDALNTFGIGTRVSIYTEGRVQVLEQYPTRGYESSVSSILHFGLGRNAIIDTMVILWPGGKMQQLFNVPVNQLFAVEEKNAKPFKPVALSSSTIFKRIPSPLVFDHLQIQHNDFDRQPLLMSKASYSAPCFTSGDLNHDGLDDIVYAGSEGQPAAIFLQQKNHTYISDPISSFEASRNQTGTDVCIFDANGDQLPDIYIASGGYHEYAAQDALLNDRIYINDGKGKYEYHADALPAMPVSKGCVVTMDLTGDGHLDLFVGGRLIPGRYPECPASYILINDGHGKFNDQTNQFAAEINNLGMVTDALACDINGDKIQDLIVVGEWMPVTIFIQEQGKLVNKTNDYFDSNYTGLWNTIGTADFNGDQKPDFIIGNLGTNAQLKASASQPISLVYKDFDQNGSVDPLLNSFIQGKQYPYVTRDELVKQLTYLKPRFNSFESYSDVNINDLFKKGELADAHTLQASYLETSCFLSQPNGKYKLGQLPVQAQFAPVHTVTIYDVDQDGSDDVLLCGNDSQMKIRLGKSDANYGVLLKGNGDGNFRYIPQIQSGLQVKGDVRCVIPLQDGAFFFGINHLPSVVYKISN